MPVRVRSAAQIRTNMRLSEIQTLQKAGFIPYVLEDGEPLMLFMIASNPQFGGTKPMISKGHVEKNEDLKEAAIREAEEELGLKPTNITHVEFGWSGNITGFDDDYTLTIFIGEVSYKENFGKPHYETKETVWLTLEQFKKQGRTSHVPIVEHVRNKIVSKKKGA